MLDENVPTTCAARAPSLDARRGSRAARDVPGARHQEDLGGEVERGVAAPLGLRGARGHADG